MSDPETIDLLLQLFEGLDILVEKAAVLESVFGEQETITTEQLSHREKLANERGQFPPYLQSQS